MASYVRPEVLDEALEALAARPRVIIAGATDHYPARVGVARPEDILDVSGISGLGAVERFDSDWRIGATATWSDVAAADLPVYFDGLKAAARTIGGVQIQNRATVCGNVCNASPAADGVPNLIALDAEVELASVHGSRRLPVREFLIGNRQTQRRGDELVTALHVPVRGPRSRATFAKLGSRSSLVISIVMVGAVVDVDEEDRATRASIVVGACSPVAMHLPAVEARLRGRELGPGVAREVEADDLGPLAPIDDVRGSAEYRRAAALILVRRVIEDLEA